MNNESKAENMIYCTYCNTKIRPFHAKNYDWDERDTHKKCWKLKQLDMIIKLHRDNRYNSLKE